MLNEISLGWVIFYIWAQEKCAYLLAAGLYLDDGKMVLWLRAHGQELPVSFRLQPLSPRSKGH